MKLNTEKIYQFTNADKEVNIIKFTGAAYDFFVDKYHFEFVAIEGPHKGATASWNSVDLANSIKNGSIESIEENV